MKNSNRRFRILSVDGGGIRGILPSTVLCKLQEMCGGKHPSELFDLMVGTSTGSMIVAVLAASDKDKKPMYQTSHLMDIYMKECPKVFSSSTWRTITSVYGIYGGKFSTKLRDELFQQWLGDVDLANTLVDIVIPSFELCAKRPAFFKTRKAREDPNENHPLEEVVKAALAAPIVFPVHQINEQLFMDALYGKCPSMFAIIEALKHYDVSLSDIDMLSLGTGYTTDDNAESIPKTVQSGLSFLVEVCNSTINGSSISTQYLTEHILPNSKDQYLRMDMLIDTSHMGICDVTPANLSYLQQVANDYVDANLDRLAAFARRLLEPVVSESERLTLPAFILALPPLPEDTDCDWDSDDEV